MEEGVSEDDWVAGMEEVEEWGGRRRRMRGGW